MRASAQCKVPPVEVSLDGPESTRRLGTRASCRPLTARDGTLGLTNQHLAHIASAEKPEVNAGDAGVESSNDFARIRNTLSALDEPLQLKSIERVDVAVVTAASELKL